MPEHPKEATRFRYIAKLFLSNLVSSFKTALTWLVRYPFALVIGIVVVVVGIILVKAGVDVNIGGILKYLFGRRGGEGTVVAASNTVPKKRVHADGTDIPVGGADVNGWTQWETRKWTTPTSPFRDTGTITVTTHEGDAHEVRLPTGIKDTDVDSVIEVRPRVYVVKTTSDSAQSARDLLDSLPAPPA